MGRKPDPGRKPELLERVIGYLCEHGLGELSLRPLADALGVSTFALVYHFGGKEGVVREALAELERRQRELVAGWAAERARQDTARLVLRYFRWCADPANLPVMRLVIEAASLSTTRTGLPASLREQLVSDWVELLTASLRADGLDAAEARAEATLVNAAVLGLALDLLATGERRRVDRAARRLVERLPRTA